MTGFTTFNKFKGNPPLFGNLTKLTFFTRIFKARQSPHTFKFTSFYDFVFAYVTELLMPNINRIDISM